MRYWIAVDLIKSTGEEARPIPEIYSIYGEQAGQCQNLAKWYWQNFSISMKFDSVMTQLGACAQKGGCTGQGWDLRNPPGAGWLQLSTILNSDGVTAQTIPWAPTDIKYMP